VLEELSLLLDLQTIDNRISEALKLKEQIPKDVDLCEEEHNRIEEELENEEELLFEKQKNRRALEGELETESEKLKKYQRQLFEIKDNREYQALLHEIAGEKERISRLEEEILILLEEIDECSKSLEDAKRRADEGRNRCRVRKSELEKKTEVLKEELIVREDERKRVLARMKPDLLASYERIRKGRGGVAVVTLNAGTCPGCFTALPPQFVNEVRKGSQILTCEHCGRILVWRADE
jgi:predicted  nucleic acid-binding Zn-ribbon protein